MLGKCRKQNGNDGEAGPARPTITPQTPREIRPGLGVSPAPLRSAGAACCDMHTEIMLSR
jgi:hypothetical protein